MTNKMVQENSKKQIKKIKMDTSKIKNITKKEFNILQMEINMMVNLRMIKPMVKES